MDTAEQLSSTDQSLRDRLGGNIIFWSTWALGILAVVVIVAGIFTAIFTDDRQAALETSRLVFSALLPLFGTWVGTVLAFYFSKENFKVANEANRELSRELIRVAGGKLFETSIKDAMISQIIAPITAPNDKLEDVTFKEVETAFGNLLPSGRKLTRVVVTDQKKICLAVIHRSLWDEMIRVAALAAQPIDVAKDSLKKVLGLTMDSDPRKTYGLYLASNLAYVSFKGTLADAKSKMEAIDGCQDVIVTENGNKAEPMLGWITNVEITKVLQA